ncbi:MAG TPA: hypothetical protein VEW28_06970 [Candidatus Kapabacteria bacterium]|nr:hypothetical protein [Candidatus Kapabacteria bacterium]
MKNQFLVALIAALVLGVGARLSAQPTNPQTNPQANVQQEDWQTQLQAARDENRALKNIMTAIQSIDTARQNELIQFIITDRNVRSRVISALRKNGYSVPANTDADLLVTQKPLSKDQYSQGNNDMSILRIIIESTGIYGDPTIRRILGDDLYTKINSRSDFEYSLVSSPSPQQRIQYALVDASLFGGDIIFKSGFGFGMTVGNDYVGYPFWQAGNVGVEGIIHKEMTDVRLGLNFQLGEAGITPFSISGGFNIKSRKLEGTQGFHASLEQVIDVIHDKNSGRLSFGGEFYEAFTPSITTFSLRASTDGQYRTDAPLVGPQGAKKDSLFYLALSGHGWVTYSFGSTLSGAYVRLGAGTHRITATTIGQKGSTFGQPGYTDVLTARTIDRFDPVVKIGYDHGGAEGHDWGVSLQYSNELMADGYIEIFSWLDLEAKYASIVGRDPEKWEWSDFVMISPVLHLNF